MDQLIPKDVTAALKLIEQEVIRARAHEHRMCSAHDGYAHLLEDVDALWTSTKATPRSWKQLRMDAVHIAATAVRFILDITDVDDHRWIEATQKAALLPPDRQ